MASTNKIRKAAHTFGLSAMALAIAGMVAPTLASAQDRDRGAERGERRGGDGQRGYQSRGERMQDLQRQQAQPRPQEAQRQQAPSSPAARGYTWHADGGKLGGSPNDAGSGRTAPAPQRDWRGQNAARPDGQRGNWQQQQGQRDAYRNGTRDGRTAEQWRDRRDAAQRDNRDGWRDGRRNDAQRNDRSRWQEGRRYSDGRESWRGDSSRNDRRWDRGWRNNSRYDWSSYRSRNRDAYRIGRYYSPYRNYSYSRIGIGFTLGSLFYGQNYWISDPWSYRLPEVYGPYRWVRYYDDVLLVDTYSGEVVDVIYDFFW